LVSNTEFNSILEVYDFEDILEMNDLTEEDVLYHLVEQGLIELPNPKPLDFDD